jgi:hypothetical protein
MKGTCSYTKSYYLSNCFGCLFKSCGRNKVEGEYEEYATINSACSDREAIAKQLGIHIPTADEIRLKLKETAIASSDLALLTQE